MGKRSRREQDIYLTRLRARQREKKLEWRTRKHVAILRAAEHKHRRAVFFGDSSAIAKMLAKGATEALPMPQTSLHVPIPVIFSMLDEPEKALDIVSQLARTHKDRAISDVFVAFSTVKAQDLGAHALLDKLVDEMVAQAAFQRTRIAWRGDFPKDAAQARFIKAMGIIRQLRLSHKYLDFHDARQITIFERRCRHYRHLINPQAKDEKSNAAARFADYINKCLWKGGKQLTAEARQKLCSYVSEIIDNAEQHSGMWDWTIQGYLDAATPQPQCEIVIFNFGKTISDTLDELPRDGYTWDQIGKYLDLHSQNGWFGPLWRKEDLLSVMALQPAVSSKNVSVQTDRGNGMTELIEFFQQMSDEQLVERAGAARMYIISGTTRVIFDSKYRLAPNKNGRPVLAFNDENDLERPPDRTCVMPLKSSIFPGTMIGIKFPVLATSVEDPS